MKLKMLAATAATATVTLAGLAGGTSTAHAVSDDPYDSGCASQNAWKVDSSPIKTAGGTQVGTVELWWSQGCGQNWGRAFFDPAYSGTLTVWAGTTSESQPISSGWTRAWTDMAPGVGVVAKACISGKFGGLNASGCATES